MDDYPTDEEIIEAEKSGSCPRCNGDMERESSGHERDSSQDQHQCSSCDFSYGEMAVWNAEARLRLPLPRK